ncbi:hypothetical protein Patl1_07159 [Pistacia atlantica]|uniref:Uncharacterized protein n=1 Tax=Pistacia atlantica TaxID=434234 RepID=A0ACC1AL15_9ROSI|nr:hypothetical protein Patl1_07159 [Pistacia atlantica]
MDYNFKFAIPSFTTIDFDHIWLTYLSSELFPLNNLPTGEIHVYATFHVSSDGTMMPIGTVKGCGIRLVYEQNNGYMGPSYTIEETPEVGSSSSHCISPVDNRGKIESLEVMLLIQWLQIVTELVLLGKPQNRFSDPQFRYRSSQCQPLQFHICLLGSEISKWCSDWSNQSSVDTRLLSSKHDELMGFALSGYVKQCGIRPLYEQDIPQTPVTESSSSPNCIPPIFMRRSIRNFELVPPMTQPKPAPPPESHRQTTPSDSGNQKAPDNHMCRAPLKQVFSIEDSGNV